MSVVVVLAADWDQKIDPITYYGTDEDGCLDFNSQPAKPLAVLKFKSRKPMTDCEHGVSYPAVVCDVKAKA